MKETKRICKECGCVCTDAAVFVNRGFDDDGYVCRECLSNGYFYCNHCEEYYSNEHEWASDSEYVICTQCSEYYAVCESCHEVISLDNANCYDGDYYCNNCYDDVIRDNLSNIIEDYNYKPEPEFLGNCNDNMYFGVELEVDNGNSCNAANSIAKKFTDVYLKHDGSLNSGFEIVSHPATLEYHKYNLSWEYIMNICLENSMRSHDTTTCGLHCHVSRAFFGNNTDKQDLHIAKLMLLINKFWETHIVPFSRRASAQLDRWASKPILELEESDTEEQIIDKVKNTKHRGRYQGINLSNYDTIEFRIFRGTLKLNTFIATLQFVDCICRFAKAMKLSDIYTVNWSDLFTDKEHKYPELIEYLKAKNLI